MYDICKIYENTFVYPWNQGLVQDHASSPALSSLCASLASGCEACQMKTTRAGSAHQLIRSYIYHMMIYVCIYMHTYVRTYIHIQQSMYTQEQGKSHTSKQKQQTDNCVVRMKFFSNITTSQINNYKDHLASWSPIDNLKV